MIDRVPLYQRDHKKKLCFYVDASDTHQAVIATQIPKDGIHKNHDDKRHEPICFVSGHFNDTQLLWNTLEKEAFSIMSTLEEIHWIASRPE